MDYFFEDHLSKVNDIEFQMEAKRRGYKLIKIPEKKKKLVLLPCVCGKSHLDEWYCNGMIFMKCRSCRKSAPVGKSAKEARLNWNKMIEEMKNDETD